MIGRSKQSNQVLITQIFWSLFVVVFIKVTMNPMFLNWIGFSGNVLNNSDAKMYVVVYRVMHFSNLILLPSTIIYGVKCICELIYRITESIVNRVK